MKTIILASLIFLFIHHSGNAQTTSSMSQFPTAYMHSLDETKVFFVEDSTSNKTTLHVFNPKSEKIRIYLYKDGMRLCYYTSLKEFNKPFNFSNAEAGDYTLTVCKGSGSVTRKIKVANAKQLAKDPCVLKQ